MFYHFKERTHQEIMSLLLIVLFLSSTVFDVAKGTAYDNKKLPSAVVVGTVYCYTCSEQGFSRNSHFLTGASVAVECKDRRSGQIFRKEVETNKLGEFGVNLPFSIGKRTRKIKSCSVELISSNDPNCSMASAASSAPLRLQVHRRGIHRFMAGFFTFKPLKQPILCNEKPCVEEVNSNKVMVPQNYDQNSLPPLQDPPTQSTGFLLPSIPSLLKIPRQPEKPTRGRKLNAGSKLDLSMANQKTIHPEFFFPPNPFQPPLLLPPNPLQPPPLLPPNPLQPPPAPLIPPLPPIPGLTPPPPPAVLPFPCPPFPIPSSTPFPRIPPASSPSASFPGGTSP